MTIHMRQQIRYAWKERVMVRLVGIASVHLGRNYPFTPAELPAVRIYAQSPSTERSAIATMGGPTNRRLARAMILVTDTIAAASDHVEDELDAIGAEIEMAADEDVFLTVDSVRLVKDMSLLSSDILFATLPGGDAAEVPIGVLRQAWNVAYHTLTGSPHRAA